MEKQKEDKVLVDNKLGLPVYENCVFIKLSNLDFTNKAKNFLEENKIPYMSYSDAGSAFCDSEAEFRLRAVFRETESDETIIAQKALNSYAACGDALYDAILDGSLLANDHIDNIISECLKEDDESEEE